MTFKYNDDSGACFSKFKIYPTGPIMDQGKFKLSKGLSSLAGLQECFVTPWANDVLLGYLLECQEKIGPMPKGSRLGFQFSDKKFERGDESRARSIVRALGNKATLNDEEEARLSWAKIAVGPEWLKNNLNKEDAYQSDERVDRKVA